LHARVAYDTQQQRFELQDLGFDYEAGNPGMGMLAEAFHEPVRQALEDAANQAFARQLEQLGKRLGTVLNRITPSGVVLDLSTLRLDSVQVHIGEQGVRLDGTATGNVSLVVL